MGLQLRRRGRPPLRPCSRTSRRGSLRRCPPPHSRMRAWQPSPAGDRRSIRLVVRNDDLHRNRLTVFFRLILAIPHFVWVTLWGLAAFVVSFVIWLAVVINGEVPSSLHGFVEGVRPLRDAGRRLRAAGREPVPRLPRRARLRRRCRDRPAGAAEPLERLLPADPRHSGARPRDRARRRRDVRAAGRLVEPGHLDIRRVRRRHPRRRRVRGRHSSPGSSSSCAGGRRAGCAI